MVVFFLYILFFFILCVWNWKQIMHGSMSCATHKLVKIIGDPAPEIANRCDFRVDAVRLPLLPVIPVVVLVVILLPGSPETLNWLHLLTWNLKWREATAEGRAAPPPYLLHGLLLCPQFSLLHFDCQLAIAAIAVIPVGTPSHPPANAHLVSFLVSIQLHSSAIEIIYRWYGYGQGERARIGQSRPITISWRWEDHWVTLFRPRYRPKNMIQKSWRNL